MQQRRAIRIIGGKPRRRVSALVGALALLAASAALGQETSFFRIGTGSTSGTYFPIGGIVAGAISNPSGDDACRPGGNCGVPGLTAVALSTQGSVSNVMGIIDGSLESGFSQADISYWAYQGERVFKRMGRVEKLRTIANLYPEAVHLVVRRGSGIRSVADLRGKRVSLGQEGSGTRVDAKLILRAYGLRLKHLKAEAHSAGAAADLLRADKLDGFFFIAGTPANAIADLASNTLIDLVPIAGPRSEKLKERYPFFFASLIPAGTYLNVAATETLAVGAQWLVSADVSEERVYQVTKAFWHENTRALLEKGHPKGKEIRIYSALDGLVVPLHPGARRYYSEIGIPFQGDTN